VFCNGKRVLRTRKGSARSVSTLKISKTAGREEMKEKTSHLCFAALRLLDERLLDQDEACQLLSEKTRNKRRAGSSAAAEMSTSTKQGARTASNHSSQATARTTSKAPWDSSLASATTPPAPAIVQGRYVARDGLCNSMLCHSLILSQKP